MRRAPASTPWRSWLISAAALTFALAGFLAFDSSQPARALPSYARQTGQPCGACHTDFAGLTPYGRRFKIEGYTMGGGKYRSTVFPTGDDAGDDKKPWAPPISMMSIIGFTNAQAPIPPPSAPYSANNNVVVSPISFFYGGAITDHIGAFAQVTYNAPPPGGFGSDPFAAHTWTWDNTDIRFADSATLGNLSLIYGITANNSPTVQDPWNTTPAWAFPYAVSTLGSGFGPTTLLDGSFAARVGSVGAYTYLADVIYLEASVYHTLPFYAQNSLGVDPFGGVGLFGAAPYWRMAFEPHVGNHWLEVGTFGMVADIHPWASPPTAPGLGVPVMFSTATSPQTVNYTDIGFDTQYQYQGSNYWVTLRGSFIHEIQRDPNLLIAANPVDTLNEARAYASVAYGNDNRVVLTGQYFNSWGNPDLTLYGGSPNTNGWIAEIAYIPFISSQSPGWPWFNARIGLQYTWYNEFNGTSVGASANNTLFLYLWLAM